MRWVLLLNSSGIGQWHDGYDEEKKIYLGVEGIVEKSVVNFDFFLANSTERDVLLILQNIIINSSALQINHHFNNMVINFDGSLA